MSERRSPRHTLQLGLVQAAESEDARQLQKAALQAIDVTGKRTAEVIEAESTQANLRRVKSELEQAGAAGLDLISKQTLSALDGAAIPEETRADIKTKYEAAVTAAQKAERDVEKVRLPRLLCCSGLSQRPDEASTTHTTTARHQTTTPPYS